ncbi:MAG: hypothetical protein GXX86_11500 [Propionibacterium sp.]|nr:hypothetical protein [Propionibacterium sp.]
MKPADTDPDADVRTMRSLGAALLGLAGGTALLGALYLFDLGLTGRAAALTVAALVTTAIGFVWWRRRGSRTGRWAAALLAPTSFATWVLTDNATGIPLVGVAVCAIVLEFGLRVGLVVCAGLFVVLTVIFWTMPTPLGGVIANLVLSAMFIVLGLLAAQVMARLEQARRLAEESARSRRDEALAELDRALAAERMEHARTLHDDLGQRLTLIGMGLDLAGRLRHRDPDAAWAEVEQTRAAASEALAELRTLVRALSPLTAEEAAEVDLAAALERLAGTFTGTGLDVSLVRTGASSDERLDPLAYRIIQESLTNVVRHSDARRVTVTVDAGDEQVVRVGDDGTLGADSAAGFGLRNLRARVEAAGGTFRAGREASGFVVEARFPAQVPA